MVERDLHLAAVFKGDGVGGDLRAAIESGQHRGAERGFGKEYLFEPHADHVFDRGGFGAAAGMTDEVGDRVGDHDGAAIRGEQQDAIAQGVEHLVQVGLERGVALFLAAHLAAEAVDAAGDAADGIGAAGRRIEQQSGLVGERRRRRHRRG